MQIVSPYLTENDKQNWSEFRQLKTIIFTDQQKLFICTLYSDVFNKKLRDTQEYKRIIRMIEKIDEIYNN